MPGTLLLTDLHRINEDELAEHVQHLFAAPTSSDSLTNPLGTGNALPATADATIEVPPVVEQAPQELQDHLAQLLNPPPPPEPEPVAPAPTPSPSTAEPPAPSSADPVLTQLADHVSDLTGGSLKLIGQGLSSLGQGAQQVAGNVVSLLPQPQPAPPSAGAASSAAGGGQVVQPQSLGDQGTIPARFNIPVDQGPSITRDQAEQIVKGTPLEGMGGQIWDLGVKYNVDPAFAFAVGKHESAFGDPNVAPAQARNNNIWDISNAAYGGTPVPGSRWGQYPDKLTGAEAFYKLITSEYYPKGQATVGSVMWGPNGSQQHAYAPLSENSAEYPGRLVDTMRSYGGGLPGAPGGPQQTTAQARAADLGYRDVSQFGDPQLTTQEAYAACGPAAAVRFAEKFGRNPSLSEALDLAKTVGWTQGGGMAGITSQQALMTKLGVDTKIVSGAQWDAFAREAQTGNPVTISTPGHYFFADGYNPQTGAFHVGRSGLDLKSGAEWMTPQQMESLMGQAQGALFANNPTVPAKSTSPNRDTVDGIGTSSTDQQAASTDQPRPLQLIGQGLSALGDAAQGFTAPGGPLGQLAQNVGSAASGALQGLADTSGPMTAGQQPTPSDTLTNPLGTGNAPEQPSAQLTGQPAGGIAEREGPAVLPALDQAQQALRAGDTQGALDALGQARDAVATSAVGPALGMLRGPELLSDQEVLQSREARTAREILAQTPGPPATDDEVVRVARSLMLGQAAAGTHEAPGGRFGPGGREALTGHGMLRDALSGLDAYPRDIAASVRDWATSADAPASQVASTVQRWIQENPLASVPERATPATVERVVTELDTNLRRGGGGAPLPTRAQPGQLGLGLGEAVQPIMQPPGEGGFRAPDLTPWESGPSIEQLRIIEEQRRINAERAARGPETPLSPEQEALARSRTAESGQVALPEMPSTTPSPVDRLVGEIKVSAGERPKPTGLQQANTVRLAGLLSQTITHLVNATGNVVNGAASIPDHVLASGIDWARVAMSGGQRERYAAETLPMIKSWGPGFIAHLPEALQILKTGLSSGDLSKLEGVGPGLNSYYTRVFGVPVGRLLTQRGGKIADTAIEMPLRMLQAADVLFRGGAMNAYANGIAVRQALREGLRGPALEQRVSYIMQNLDQFPSLRDEANAKAARAVFQEKREIPFVGRAIGRSDVGQFIESQVLPFTKTPYNISAQGAGRSPFGFAGAAHARRAGNIGEAEDRAARAILGSTTFGVALWMGAHGLLTGDRPDDSSTLPQGWRPWSVRVPVGDGAVYVPMQNFGAFGWPMAMAAIGTDATHRGKSWADPSQVPQMGTSIGSYVLDSTFLQGLSDTIDMLQDPKRFADRWAQGEAASFVPFSGMGRELQNIAGMVQRDPREGVQGVLDAMAAANPVTAGNVPERTNALGDPVAPSSTGLAAAASPVRTSVEADDPTLKVLRENGVGIQNVAKQINVPSGHVDLTDEEQAQFKKARGELIKRYVGGETRGADFQKGSPLARTRYLSDAVSRANRDAKEQVITQWAADRAAWHGRIQPKAVPEPYYVGGAADQ